ncbi:MAG: ATP-binding protein, partial [Candidatus Nanopelagicales bacterium]
VSHELRTPVTTVRLAADLLHAKRDEFPPEMARAAELLQGELDRFEVMLADLLEISRMDAGASPLQISNYQVAELVQRALDSVAPVAVAANIQINVVDSAPELEINIDSRRIERALRNLVTNAIKHSGTAIIEITISATDNSCEISVADYGIGLTTEQKAQVFERFWRADPSRSRDHGGSGLGLSIAMEDVKQHDGEIEVRDTQNGGTTFVIKLPRSKTVLLA